MVSSQARREQVALACERGLSKRRACELIEIARSGLCYVSVRAERDAPTLEAMKRLAAQYPQLVAKDAELAVKMILDAMAKRLAKGERIEIRGFGSFGLNYRPPRTGRNPKSGERVHVPEKHVPHFKAGKELRERVDFKKQP